MWGVEEEKNLVCKDEKEFRARLKKSFSAGESSEAFSAQQCLVCCEDLKVVLFFGVECGCSNTGGEKNK
jgi:hypothetical protein